MGARPKTRSVYKNDKNLYPTTIIFEISVKRYPNNVSSFLFPDLHIIGLRTRMCVNITRESATASSATTDCSTFTLCPVYVHSMFLYVHSMFTLCSLNVHSMFSQCSLNVHSMFTQYSHTIDSTFTKCALNDTECPINVHSMFIQRSLNAH
jgi:hypothetical protein